LASIDLFKERFHTPSEKMRHAPEPELSHNSLELLFGLGRRTHSRNIHGLLKRHAKKLHAAIELKRNCFRKMQHNG
jgi:hypothetical protein